MFAIHATAIKYIGLLESPSPLNMAAITLYATIKGIPAKHTFKYALVSSIASSGVLITLTIGATSTSNTNDNTTATNAKSTIVFPIVLAILRRSFAPTNLAIITTEPIASPTIITVSMCIT